MAKKRRSDMRRAKREIRREVNKSLSAKDKRDLRNLKCAMKENMQCHATGSCFYFLGFIGALVYYISHAPSLWAAFVGFFQALLWPAFLVYEALKFMGM